MTIFCSYLYGREFLRIHRGMDFYPPLVQKLFSIGSKTSLVAVMLGLLAPKEHRYIEKSAIDEAENMTRVFVEDVNFLFSVITDHQISKRTLNKYNGKLRRFA